VGTTASAESSAAAIDGSAKLAAISAAAHIAPYMPLAVCESAASRNAMRAARTGSPAQA